MIIPALNNPSSQSAKAKSSELLSFGGLSEQKAAALLKQHGYNEIPGSQRQSLLALVFSTVSEPIILLLVVAALFITSLEMLRRRQSCLGSSYLLWRSLSIKSTRRRNHWMPCGIFPVPVPWSSVIIRSAESPDGKLLSAM